jgi:hypothetical protein
VTAFMRKVDEVIAMRRRYDVLLNEPSSPDVAKIMLALSRRLDRLIIDAATLARAELSQ